MVIAYLILAHNTPNHLQRLIARLRGPGRKIFVHVDRKSDIRKFNRRDTPEDVCFIENRVPVFWGDYSSVEATTRLMKRALADDEMDFDYLVLLSGSDYPIRSQEYIGSYFDLRHRREFIGAVSMPNDEVFKHLSRLTSYRFQGKELPGYARLIGRLNRMAGHPKLQRDYQKVLGSLRPYAGTQWWALSGHACLHILKFMEDHPQVIRFFRNTHLPDESLFHTIMGNSPFRDRMTLNPTAAHWKPSEGSPATLNAEMLRTLLGAPILKTGLYGTGEVMFLRKFPDDSDDLVKIVDEEAIYPRPRVETAVC